ncbi:MAG: hypothetical protein K6G49_03705 [Candidatus Saccharibacteria bacterium]|nr:hypothetical protein [Candidatus Saccharibacteria bacterium]
MKLSGELIQRKATKIAKEAGFYTVWSETSSTPGVDDKECFEWYFSGYGFKIIVSGAGKVQNLYLKYQGKIVFRPSYQGEGLMFDADWVDILCLVYDRISLLSEVMKLCNDWNKYIGKTYESDGLKVLYGKIEGSKREKGVKTIHDRTGCVYTSIDNVSRAGDWMQEMRSTINDEIENKKCRALSIERHREKYSRRESEKYKRILLGL